MQHPELEKGPVPVDADLRWLAEMRDFMRRSTMGMVGTMLHIQVDSKGGVHAHLQLEAKAGKELTQALRHTAIAWAKKSPAYRLHRVDFYLGYFKLLLYKRREKKFGRKR